MIIIKVTQEHIDKGERESPWCCPVALACQDAGLIEATVDSIGIAWSASEDYLDMRPLPNHVADKVHNYDKTGIMFPFEFALI
jgi:hypothetical protein